LSIPKPKLSLSSSKDSRGDIMIHEMVCFYYYTIVVYIYFTWWPSNDVKENF
jgi:hypothetical protein